MPATRARAGMILSAVTAMALSCRSGAAQEGGQPAFEPVQIEFFEKQIRPVLVERCYKCHGGGKHEGNLQLNSRRAVLKGGNTGPAVVPGKPDAGELLLAISYDPDGYQMPPDGKLPEQQIAAIRKWIEMGAPWPNEASDDGDPGGDRIPPYMDAAEFHKRAQHWSFRPLTRPAVPQVSAPAWCRTPIDRFLLAELEKRGLNPAGAADKRTWLRRIYFDTIGLPPTVEEIGQFVSDESVGAEEGVIERLLGSPHFGERWGRHWLDLVRYAESRGHEFDYDVANPWHYRDYVIRAINDDLPFDRFVVEHVAGDLLRETHVPASEGELEANPLIRERYCCRLDPLTGGNESIVATGWWFLGEWVHSPVDIRQDEADRFDNMIDVYSKAFLGLTVACARCHDHKFDPITQKDYYALQGFLQSSSYGQVRFESMEHNRRIRQRLAELDDAAQPSLLGALGELLAPLNERLPDYLLAARQVIHDLPEQDRKVSLVPSGDHELNDAAMARLTALAAARGLDPQLLEQWTEHLLRITCDRQDPFYLWAEHCIGELSEVSDVICRGETLCAPPISEPVQPLLSPHDQYPAVVADDDAVVFCPPGGEAGFRLWLSDDPARPIALASPRSGIVRIDPDFQSLVAAEGTLPEAGSVANAGVGAVSIRTTSFEIGAERLYCHVQGGCTTYVVVDSHTLIKGPLHGSLLKEHPPLPQWHWIEHDVSRYRGHRAHLEFLVPPGKSFAVVQIVQADQLPQRLPLRLSAWPLIVGRRAENALLSNETWDEQKLVRMFSLSLPAGEVLRQSPPGEGTPLGFQDGLYAAELLNWIVRHPQLVGLDRPEAQQRLAEAARPFVDRRRELVAQIRRVSNLAPAMREGSGEDEYLFIRGNWKKRGETVPRRFLEVFRSSSADEEESIVPGRIVQVAGQAPHATSGSGRLKLALHMVDPVQTPLLPRVIVNRIWQHYFGRGIVATPDDFGHLGQAPSHPELLDWLAVELVEHDWSLKHIHRLILSSAAYRMACEGQSAGSAGLREASAPRGLGEGFPGQGTGSQFDVGSDSEQVDPDNILLHRMNVKRLEGEVIRDTVLYLSGRLDERLYGPSTPVHLTPFMEGRGRPAISGPVDGEGRRSIYISVRRNFPDPFFQAFDFPNPHSTIGRRTVSNVPAQALALMNSPLILEQSEWWGRRVAEATSSAEHRLNSLYESAYGRRPSNAERAAASAFLARQAESYGCAPDDARVWCDLCHVLINTKEFLFVR